MAPAIATAGARWNSGRGRGVVYASLNVATCVLETFVHFGPRLRAKLPGNFVLGRSKSQTMPASCESDVSRSQLTPTGRVAMGAPGISGPATTGWSEPKR